MLLPFFILIIFSIIIFIGSWIFLLGQTQDYLAQFIPSQAETYLHTKIKTINSLEINKFTYFINFLSQKSNLKPEQWQELIKNIDNQVGFFTINQQIFLVTNKNNNLIKYLESNNLSFLEQNDLIYYPELKLNETSLDKQAWFIKIKPKTYFNDFNIYIKDPNSLNLAYTFNKSENEPILIKGIIKSNTVKLLLKDSVLTKNHKKFESEPLNSDFIAYFNGITVENLEQQTNFSANNFIYHLAQSINGPIELLRTTTYDKIVLQKKLNNIENIKQSISNILAYIYPTEKQKELPDGTIATNYIADPAQWTLALAEHTDEHSNYLIQNIKPDFNVSLEESTDNITVIFNQNSNISTTEQDQVTAITTKDCSNFTTKSYIMINPKQFSGLSNLTAITITFDAFNNTSVCID